MCGCVGAWVCGCVGVGVCVCVGVFVFFLHAFSVCGKVSCAPRHTHDDGPS